MNLNAEELIWMADCLSMLAISMYELTQSNFVESENHTNAVQIRTANQSSVSDLKLRSAVDVLQHLWWFHFTCSVDVLWLL